MARAHKRVIYRRQGRCLDCGARSRLSASRCARCLAWNRAYHRARYAQLRQDGVCVQCAKTAAVYPHVRCETCRAYMREYHRAYHRGED